jgi:hypothetical protein
VAFSTFNTCMWQNAHVHKSLHSELHVYPLRRRVASSPTPWSHILLDEVLPVDQA